MSSVSGLSSGSCAYSGQASDELEPQNQRGAKRLQRFGERAESGRSDFGTQRIRQLAARPQHLAAGAGK